MQLMFSIAGFVLVIIANSQNTLYTRPRLNTALTGILLQQHTHDTATHMRTASKHTLAAFTNPSPVYFIFLHTGNMLYHATGSLQTGWGPDYLSSHRKMCQVASSGQVPPRLSYTTPPMPAQLFDLSQVATQPSDQPTHNLCPTLCLVYMCKAIHDQAWHSGVHHLVPSRQDPLRGGVEVVTKP